MHIVHVIARLNDGGPARVLAALARTMIARGHRVTVLAGSCAPDEPDLSDEVRASGAALEHVPGFGRRLRPTGDCSAVLFLLKRLPQLAPDVVHTHTAKAGVLGRLVCRARGLRCLHTYHGHVLHGYFSAAGDVIVRTVERLSAGPFHHQALTPSQARDLRDRARIGRPSRWTVLPVPVQPVAPLPAAWHSELDPTIPVMGFLGRLAPVKDGALFLAVLAELSKRMRLQGVVCGDGQERGQLEAQARASGVTVRFTGFIPAGEALAAMDVLVLTSRNEGLPLAAFEAASAGVAVVAPPVGGLADMIRWRAALGARRNAPALADAVHRVLTDTRLRRRLVARAKQVQEGVTPEALAPRYERLYRSIVEGHR
ncbi:MAG: glycosyltransferase family 4 protein [Planctomycetes bacterium]|nr:glycosyltransferase family 4 protein [Planctomycetota bacterium]